MNRGQLSSLLIPAVVLITLAGTISHATGNTSGWTLVGWNDLGMHCMDDDYAVFSILPPYNTIHAQLVDPSGHRINNPSGISLSYQAVADPSGSINSSSVDKTNFWQYVGRLFGAEPPPDEGLAGARMPGALNSPRPMVWDAGLQCFTAEGIPLTLYDDARMKNYYPMMRLTAKNSSGTVLATTDIVLPISDEMDCRSCHGSGSSNAARPLSGWVNSADPVHDYRLNILRLHDEREGGNALFLSALAEAGYDAQGLEATQASGTPILCARCHGSNALPGTGFAGVPPLTQVVHDLHAFVTDPDSGMALDASGNRSACYSCHPGSDTRCLRGAMGHAVDSSGELSIQCQDCHGGMSMVGSAGREGWFDEPTCQSCHTGTATSNSGQIRFTSAFASPGVPRQPADSRFATNPDTPAPGISLFRFSSGHGGLQCEACHGSTHAIFPSSHENDNVQNVELQGSPGTLADCTTCHGTSPSTVNEGPHGLHPIGQSWVSDHHSKGGGDKSEPLKDEASSGCNTCHGTDYRGTVLSRSLTDKTVSTPWGNKHFWKGYQIGCYTCHNGPSSDHQNHNHPPAVDNTNATTSVASPVPINLSATDADGDSLTLRVISQPAHGRVGINGRTALFTPDPAFSGSDTFTFAASDGMADSNLGTTTVTVNGGGCELTCSASGPSSVQLGATASFAASVDTSGCTGTPSFLWSFGDGSTSNEENPAHIFAASGSYTWSMTATLEGNSCSSSGSIVVESGGGGCVLNCSAEVPATGSRGESLEFRSGLSLSGCSGQVSYLWDFGDGSTSSEENPSHAYQAGGSYDWTLGASLDGSSCSSSGTIGISEGPATGAYRYVTVAAHSEGRNDRSWRTDLAVLNLNPNPANLQMSFEGTVSGPTETLVLNANQSREWRDLLSSLIGLESDASGALTLRSDQPLIITSHTYVIDGDGATIGQYFPAVKPSEGVESGTVSIIPNIGRSADELTNLGFLNLADSLARVRVQLYGSDGTPIGAALERQVSAAGWRQIDDVFMAAGLGDTDLAWATVEVLTEGGLVWPYASLLDRRTGDPITIGAFVLP